MDIKYWMENNDKIDGFYFILIMYTYEHKMIVINHRIEALNLTISFYIGRNAEDNFKVIDIAEQKNPENLWFHVQDKPSNHVVAEIPTSLKLDKKQMRYIVTQGAVFCKQYSSYKSDSNVKIIWTKIKNIKKTSTLGSVLTNGVKTVTI